MSEVKLKQFDTIDGSGISDLVVLLLVVLTERLKGVDVAGLVNYEDRILRDLRELLTDLLKQSLPRDRWRQVELLVVEADQALARADLAGVQRRTTMLESFVSERAVPLGARPRQPVPPRLRERIALLIHRTTQWRRDPSVGGGRADAPRPTD